MGFTLNLRLAEVMRITKDARDGKKPALKLSERGKKIFAALTENDFGCSKKAVVNLVSAIIGETLPIPTSQDGPPSGAAVVLLSNPNSHDYPLNEVILVREDTICLKSNLLPGNNAPFETPSAWRYATDKEIVKAFKD